MICCNIHVGPRSIQIVRLRLRPATLSSNHILLQVQQHFKNKKTAYFVGFLEAHRRKNAVIWKYNRRFEIMNEDIKLKNSTASALVRRRIIFVCLSENGDYREKT